MQHEAFMVLSVLLLPPINIDENTLQNALTSLLEIISQGLP